MKLIYFVFSVFLVLPVLTRAQLPDSVSQKIDDLFLDWNRPNHPGGAVGIMQDGQLAFSKAYGLASLEYLVPNAPGTQFNLGSISKQFTAMGILLLEQQGKLSVDDDVRKYLPGLPDFGETITIRHLMHHTSGMRSMHFLLEMAGWRGTDFRSNEDLRRFMRRQKDLNFKPGDQYLYCNTGYMLMADIIEKVTGESFADWMKRSVFLPLGMFDTYVEDNPFRVVPNNATSYYGSNEGPFDRATEFWGYVGSGNVHASTGDVLKWLSNFYEPAFGWEAAFARMQTRGVLNNGDTLTYAFGINVGSYKGERLIQHGGAVGGYRAFAMVFPDKKLSIVLLTNFSSSNPWEQGYEVADLVLGKVEPPVAEGNAPTPAAEEQTPAFTAINDELLNSYAGYYYSPELETTYELYVDNHQLKARHPRHGEMGEVKVLQKDELEAPHPLGHLSVQRDKKGKLTGIRASNGRVRNLWMERKNS
ncbi:MAG: beta-lactamase family protein [Lewinellaceae bacterium]|nr:beta-lactamase family protein [Lewinellaceae bacterium]